MAQPTAPYAGHLVIHTGDHKTGTTSIQEGLARGDVTLVEGRLAYPLGKGEFNHNGLFQRRRRRRILPVPSVPVDKPFTRFATQTKRRAAEVTVMSAERLESAAPDLLARALAAHQLPTTPDRLSVVTYLRPHLSRVMSSLAERVKTGWASDDPWRWLDLAEGWRLRYAKRMAAWDAVFGEAHIVRPFIRAELAAGEALADLMHSALGPGQVKIAQVSRSNTSLGVEDLMRLHVIHRALPELDRWAHHHLGWYLADQIETLRPAGAASTPLRPHKAFASRMRRAFLKDARAIDTRYFDGRPLFAAALDKAVDTAEPTRIELRPAAWLTAAEISALEDRARDYEMRIAAPGWQRKINEDRLARILAGGTDTAKMP